MKHLNKKVNENNNAEFVVTPKRKRILGTVNYGALFRALFFFLLVTVPIGVFAYVIYHSTGLQIYKDSEIWTHMGVPNANNIFILFWVGMGCMIAAAIMICLFWVVTKYTMNKKLQTGYVFGIIFLAVLGVLLASLSQYFYAKFFDFYLYEAKTQATTNLQPWARDLSIALTADYNKGNGRGVFDWMQSSVVWWVMFVQFMFLFGSGVTLQNALNAGQDLNDYEKYIADTKQEDAGIDFSKINKFFKDTFSNNDKSIAKFLIIAAVVIVIPNFIYSVIGTVETTHMQAVIAWSFKVPTLIKDTNFGNSAEGKQIVDMMNTLSQGKYGTVFMVSSLPIIFEGLTISTVFFFIAMLLRGKNVSNRIFIFESAILLAEVLALVSVAFVSKVYLHRLTDFWQQTVGDKTNISLFTNDLKGIIGDNDFNALAGADGIKGMYPLNGIANVSSIHIEWLDMSATIAEAVIAYAWVFGTFTIIGTGIYKLGYFKKEGTTTYKSGIFNS